MASSSSPSSSERVVASSFSTRLKVVGLGATAAVVMYVTAGLPRLLLAAGAIVATGAIIKHFSSPQKQGQTVTVDAPSKGAGFGRFCFNAASTLASFGAQAVREGAESLRAKPAEKSSDPYAYENLAGGPDAALRRHAGKTYTVRKPHEKEAVRATRLGQKATFAAPTTELHQDDYGWSTTPQVVRGIHVDQEFEVITPKTVRGRPVDREYVVLRKPGATL